MLFMDRVEAPLKELFHTFTPVMEPGVRELGSITIPNP